jgi:hypothetical protein
MEDEFKSFNKALKVFIRSTIESFPDLVEFKIALVVYKMLKTINKKKPFRLTFKIIENHQEQILNKDEEYFMTHQVDFIDPRLQPIFKTIEKSWHTFTPQDKEALWQHLQVLVLLGRRCKKIDN